MVAKQVIILCALSSILSLTWRHQVPWLPVRHTLPQLRL